MNVAYVNSVVNRIEKVMRYGDMAHEREVLLFEQVLKAIAEKRTDDQPSELARAALKSLDLEIDRLF